MRKVKAIKEVEPFDIYDITVDIDHCFELYNGVIAHNSLYPKDIVSGGTGSYYSSDNIWIIGRQQEKDGDELVGWNFVINIEKSRYAKEKTKIPITVTYAHGIDKWSGFLDNAVESGHIIKNTTTKPHKYFLVDRETGEFSEEGYPIKDIPDTVWKNLMKDEHFISFIKTKYSVESDTTLMQKENDDV